MTNPDPAIEEVRRTRHQISEQLNHDPAKLVEHYKKLQQEYGDRLVVDENAVNLPGRPAA